MKKSALVVSGLVVLLALAGISFGMKMNVQSTLSVARSEKVTVEQARKIALKRVEGTVEDEYTFENDEGEVETYIFIIKKKDNKIFEVQVGAEKGDIISVEEYTEEDEPDDEPEDPPVFS